MATLRGLLSGSTTAAATATAAAPSSTAARRTRVAFEDEGTEEDGRGSKAGNGDGSIMPVHMTLGRFNGGGGGRTRMVFTDQGWQVGASTNVI